MEADPSLTRRLVPNSRMGQGMVCSLECFQTRITSKVLVEHLKMYQNQKTLGRINDNRLKMM